MLIGAYYYGLSGNWLKQTVRQNDPPIRGEYDNTKYGTTVIDQMLEMKEAGIDFISVSWGHGERKDYGHILDAAKETGMKVTYFYESLVHWSDKRSSIPAYTLEAILENIEIIKEDMLEDCWLKINGCLVLMLYVTRCFKEQPDKIFREIRRAIPNVYLVGDELFWDDIKDERIRMFDAVTAYNYYQPGRFSQDSPEDAAKTYLENVRHRASRHAQQCHRLNVPLWGTAMPGYNDKGVRGNENHYPIPRLEGNFFKASLNDARKNSIPIISPCIMITSASEWYEDTQIEPTESYGDLYIKILKDFKGIVEGEEGQEIAERLRQ